MASRHTDGAASTASRRREGKRELENYVKDVEDERVVPRHRGAPVEAIFGFAGPRYPPARRHASAHRRNVGDRDPVVGRYYPRRLRVVPLEEIPVPPAREGQRVRPAGKWVTGKTSRRWRGVPHI